MGGRGGGVGGKGEEETESLKRKLGTVIPFTQFVLRDDEGDDVASG